jgi:hypothetical protein
MNEFRSSKECSKCGQEKPLSEFTPNKKGKYGRHSICRACAKEYHREKSGFVPPPSLPGEIWKEVFDYEGQYSVSNFGRVRRDKHSRGARGGHILTQTPNRKGYPTVYLHPRRILVHSLVAEAFIGPRPEGLTVNHINGVKTDNLPHNLEYLTRQENTQHAKQMGLINFGERVPCAKLNPTAVRNIRTLHNKGWTKAKIARRYQVTHSVISAVLAGRTWKHVS